MLALLMDILSETRRMPRCRFTWKIDWEMKMNFMLLTAISLMSAMGCQGVRQSDALPDESIDLHRDKAVSMELIAHRGASHDAPENTLASVTQAWEQKADAVEIDIWLTKDQQIVLMHDKTPKRYGGPDTLVSDMTLDQLRALDVGAWKDPRWKGEKVPLLSEVLQLIPAGKRLFIEIKCGPEVLPPLQTALEESNIPSERVVLIGFSETTMKLAQKRFPDLETYWIVSIKKDSLTQRPNKSAESIVKTFSRIGVTGLDLGGDSSLLTQSFLSEIRTQNIPWYVWTIDSVSEATRLRKLGARGITTNRPGFLRESLRQISEE